jgi:hypothetical protein
MPELDPIERRRARRRAEGRQALVIVGIVAAALLGTVVLAGGVLAVKAYRSPQAGPGPVASAIAPFVGPPESVRGYIRENFNEDAEVRATSYLRVKGTMQPTFGDHLSTVARNEDIKHTGKSKIPVPDQRVDGVYFVEFKKPAGFDGDWGNYSKRWLFYMHPSGGVAVPMQVVSEDWRDDVRDWVPDGK